MSLWKDLGDPVFDGVGLVDFKSGANAFLLAKSALFASYYFLFFFIPWVVWGWGLWIDSVLTLSRPCTADSILIIIIIIFNDCHSG